MLLRFLFIFIACSTLYAQDLEFVPRWMKEQHYIELVDESTQVPHGYAEYWVIHNHEQASTEGVLRYLQIKQYAQGKGLGGYLFSRVISEIGAVNNIKKTRWYAYPLNKDTSDKLFEKKLKQLEYFYTRLGGIFLARGGGRGCWFSFDHEDTSLLSERKKHAKLLPIGYKLQENPKKKDVCCSAYIFYAGTKKIVAEVQYKKKYNKNMVTGMQMLDVKVSKKTIKNVIHLVSQKLEVSQDAVTEAFCDTQEKMPEVYDDLFHEGRLCALERSLLC